MLSAEMKQSMKHAIEKGQRVTCYGNSVKLFESDLWVCFKHGASVKANDSEVRSMNIHSPDASDDVK